MKIAIKDTLRAIDLLYNNKITLEDYDEMTSKIENIMKKFSKMW
ncbi:hypothetical protein [Clostridium drakei]|nr:hypothetical protein [Clostridium drakei]